MKRADELIKIQADDHGRMWIPPKLQKRLIPGTVLTVESQEQGTVWVSVRTELAENQADEHTEKALDAAEGAGPQLVKKGRVTVVRGQVPEGFDWDAFIQEGREERLQDLLSWGEK
jgi:hypothetical protein